jgi:hypothetical protein
MRHSLLVTLLLNACCLVSVPCYASDGNEAPQMNSLSARTAKPGDTLVISGISLNENRIDEVYLTDHKFDMKMKVLEQKDSYIKVRVPPFAKPGRMQILCLTKGDEPKLLEQPLYLLIKDPTDVAEEATEPAVEEIQMKVEDLPKLGSPISIPIQSAAPVSTEAATAKKAESIQVTPGQIAPSQCCSSQSGKEGPGQTARSASRQAIVGVFPSTAVRIGENGRGHDGNSA